MFQWEWLEMFIPVIYDNTFTRWYLNSYKWQKRQYWEKIYFFKLYLWSIIGKKIVNISTPESKKHCFAYKYDILKFSPIHNVPHSKPFFTHTVTLNRFKRLEFVLQRLGRSRNVFYHTIFNLISLFLIFDIT